MGQHGVTLREAARIWWRIAWLSFGGPAGQIAVMHRILVEEQKWIGEERFLHALNFCMLLPGPEAQQLATYVGWLLHRVRGGLVAGGLFILPGFLTIMVLSWFYLAFGGTGPAAALLLGLKAAVLAIILDAVRRIGSRALRTPAMAWLAWASFVAIFFFAVPFPLIVLGAGLAGFAGGRLGAAGFGADRGNAAAEGARLADAESLLGAELPAHARPDRGRLLGLALVLLTLWLSPVAILVLSRGAGDVFSQIALFFSQMAVVTFGGAYAVLAYVAQQAVDHYQWLRPGEMLDGLGLAETTPGPLIMVTQFVGFLGASREATGMDPFLAGTIGAILTTWVTFVPCFLWIFLGAPFSERLRGNRALAAALAAVTAAVVGVIANLALWFALHTLFREVRELAAGPLDLEVPVLASLDPAALLLAAAALVAQFRLRLSTPALIAAGALAGLILHTATDLIG